MEGDGVGAGAHVEVGALQRQIPWLLASSPSTQPHCLNPSDVSNFTAEDSSPQPGVSLAYREVQSRPMYGQSAQYLNYTSPSFVTHVVYGTDLAAGGVGGGVDGDDANPISPMCPGQARFDPGSNSRSDVVFPRSGGQ